MDNSVKAQPNHYEILGITPAASGAEIAQAFARKMSAFAARPLAAAAQISIAFETLRDPERRKKYDALLRPPAPQLGYSARWNSVPWTSSALAPPAAPAPAPARPEAPPQAVAAPKPEPFIASPEPANAAARSEAPKPKQQPRPEPFVEQQRAIQRAIERGSAAQPEESESGLNRTALAIGGVVLGVGVLGAVAGWSAGLVEQPQQPEARVALPRPKPVATLAAAEPAPAWTVAQARPERRMHAAAAVARTSRAAPLIVPEELQSDASEAAQGEPAVADAQPTAAVVPASLSLPNHVIARTIGRIGYACGEVASTAPVEGAGPGVFRVTCTSGHSYQATPVRGRYHFRRLSSR
jgi:hypothetical protein